MIECIKTLSGCRLLRLNQFTLTQNFDTGAMIMLTLYCNPLFLISFYLYITFLENVHLRNVLQYLEETMYSVPSVMHHVIVFFVLAQSFLLKALN